jgi:PilZ domain-containing protein
LPQSIAPTSGRKLSGQKTVEKALNRRGTSRRPPRGRIKVECHVGTTGLGRNIARQLLDLSRTGARLLVTQELAAEVEVELCVTSYGRPKPLRAPALVVRSQPAEEGLHVLSIHFERPLDFASWQQVT